MNFEKLGDIAHVTPGTSPKGSLINSKNLGLPFFQGSKEFKELYPLPERYTEHPVKVAKSGDVLISVRAPVGEVNFAREDCAIGRGVMSVRAKKESEQAYIFYFLKNLKGEWSSLGSTGSVFENLSTVALKNVDIPDGLNREAIGEVLFNLDQKIELNNSLSKTLEDISQTIFKSWFIDFDPVKAKMADEKPEGMDDATAALFPDSMEESEIGMIPRSWELTSAGDFCPFKYGKALPASNRVFGEVPVYGSNGVVGTHNQALTSGPSIIVGRKGTVGTVNLELAPCWVIDTAFYVDTKELADIYLAYFQLQNLGLSEMNSDGAVPGLNRDNAQRLTFTVGNPALRKRFGEIAHYIFMQIANLKEENSSLTALRDSLLPRLISGELRIPDEMLAS